MDANLKQGDVVLVTTHDGRKMRAKVLHVFNTTGGIKIKVESGPLILTIGPDQIQKAGK